MNKENNGTVWMINSVGSARIGGGETSRDQWTNEFIHRGKKVVWYCPTADISQRDYNPYVDGIEVRYHEDRYNHFSSTINSANNFSRRILSEQPNLIIFNGTSVRNIPFMEAVLKKGYASKTVVVSHGDPVLKFNTSVKGFLLRGFCKANLLFIDSLGKNGGKIMAVSEYVKERLKETGITSEVKVCYPPTSKHDDCNPTPRNGFDGSLDITTVSRISPEKGLSFLGLLAMECNALALPTIMSLVGPDTNKVFFDQLRRNFGKLVNFKGARVGSDLCCEYRSADVTVMPSTNEGFGLVTIESLQHGAPVVARNKVARELLGDQDSKIPGLIIEGKNIRDQLAMTTAYFKRLITEEGYLRSQSELALKVGSRFNPSEQVSKYVNYVLS